MKEGQLSFHLDICSPNPCENGGICEPYVDPLLGPAPTCYCDSGWYGDRCTESKFTGT